VTTNKVKNDKASMFVVKEAHEVPMCEVGTPIKCGDHIRLEHVETKKNIHSHLFRAPLSGNQEVSGFGDGGNGDTGDNWQVVCEGNEIYWQRGKVVSFMHVDTKKYLSSSDTFKFNHQNCGGGCPILDQTEVSASAKKDVNAKWNTDQGVYFPSKNANLDEDDEL
jgi:dolichyl-phosphate-mannose--protein O-mannosyl transferase